VKLFFASCLVILYSSRECLRSAAFCAASAKFSTHVLLSFLAAFFTDLMAFRYCLLRFIFSVSLSACSMHSNWLQLIILPFQNKSSIQALWVTIKRVTTHKQTSPQLIVPNPTAHRLISKAFPILHNNSCEVYFSTPRQAGWARYPEHQSNLCSNFILNYYDKVIG